MAQSLRRLAFAICLAGLLILLPAQAQSPIVSTSWIPAKKLGDGWWDSVAVDREGRAHIGWYGTLITSDGVGHDVLSYVSRSWEGVWTEPNDVIYTGEGGYTVRNALAVTSNGTLYAFFRQYVNHDIAQANALQGWNGQSWSMPVQLFSPGYFLDMIVDRNDVVHVVSSSNSPVSQASVNQAELQRCAYCYDLFYRRSEDGHTWSAPAIISASETTGSDRPQIFEGASGRLYIVWEEGPDWYHGRMGLGAGQDVRMRYSEDGGLSWSDLVILDGGGYQDRFPVQGTMAEIDDRKLLFVWRYDSFYQPGSEYIYYQFSDDLGVTWTSPEAIPNIFARGYLFTPLDHYFIITDHLKVAHLFLVGSREKDGPSALYHMEYRNRLWEQPRQVYYDPQRRPEWPDAAIGPQNEIHLVWFTRGPALRPLKEGETDFLANLEVWYSFLPGNLPMRPTQAFSPTNTPQPTAIIEISLDPTSTPFPTVEPVSEITTATTKDLYAINTVLGGAVFSGLFCLGIILLYRYRR